MKRLLACGIGIVLAYTIPSTLYIATVLWRYIVFGEVSLLSECRLATMFITSLLGFTIIMGFFAHIREFPKGIDK